MTPAPAATEQAFALFLAAAHAVAPELIDPPDITLSDAPPCRSAAHVWAKIRADERARRMSTLLSPTQIDQVHHVLDAMCRELTARRRFEGSR